MSHFWLGLSLVALVVNVARVLAALFLLYNNQPVMATPLTINVVATVLLVAGIAYDAGRKAT